jgi:predicted phosphodiesterase
MKMKSGININRREFLVASTALTAGVAFPSALFGLSDKSTDNSFHFVVTSDCHMYASHSTVFRDITCNAIMNNPDGPGEFIIVNGDMDPFVRVKKAIDEKLIAPLKKEGVDYGFYPAIGNHDLYNTAAEEEFRTDVSEDTQIRAILNYNKNNLKNIVNWGPESDSKLPGYENNGSKYSNYSFDYGDCHFVVIDLYYANSIPGRGNGNFHKITAEWLEQDLQQNKKEKVFVFGHEPVIPYKSQSGKEITKHMIDSNADKLWEILKKYKVDLYFCGHIHDYGVVKEDGIMQINSGSSAIVPNNTYIMIFVDDGKVTYKSYVFSNKTKKWEEYSGSV